MQIYGFFILDIKLNDPLKEEVTKAVESYTKKCNSLDINYTIIEQIGKKLCKEHSISPDAVMQLAFQVNYRITHCNTGIEFNVNILGCIL